MGTCLNKKSFQNKKKKKKFGCLYLGYKTEASRYGFVETPMGNTLSSIRNANLALSDWLFGPPGIGTLCFKGWFL